MSSGGTRVSIFFTSPPTDATVGVCVRIALSPTPGTRLDDPTITCAGEVAISFRSSFVTADTRYEPSSLKVSLATYTERAESGSCEVVLLTNCGLTSIGSYRAGYGPWAVSSSPLAM